MKGPEGVGKARMLGCLIGKIRKAELPYASQTLKLRGVDQRDDEATLVRPRVDSYDVMYRVPVDLF